ncbi:MAG: DUF1638 domain-containing protein [Deltaproteobacteria bacterium]|jgi:hypothetical protein|nr:DUF1638 domain-containing protein [Deltaproteobacteria bacterium]
MKRTLVACNILEAEIKSALAKRPDVEVEIVWLRAGLHNDMDLLEAKLNEALAKLEKGDPSVRLLIGYGCSPGLKEIAKERAFPVLATKNCLGALVGEDKLMELEKNKTMVITPSWIRKTWFAEDGMKAMLGWDETDFRINFGRYDRVLVLDFGLEPLSDEELMEAYSIIEVPIESESYPMDHFEKFFWDFLA